MGDNLASLRIGKIDQGTETAIHNHNLRASFTKKEKNVNRQLTCNNSLLIGRADTVKAINEKIESLNLKTAVRKDANRAIEFVLSASPEYFYDFQKAGITREDWDNITIEKLGVKKYWERLAEIKKFTIEENVKAWERNIVSWVNKDPDLKNNIINLVVHNDEKTKHAHLVVVPVIDGKLTAKQFFTPGRARYWQDTYARATGLKRGISSEEKHKTKTEYDVQQAMKKGHRIGQKKGYEEGYKAGIADTQKIGVKVGAVFDGFKGKWHKPSADALAKAEKLTEQAKTYADRTKQQAERLVQDERNRRRMLDRELEKKTNIATNLEAENKRLQRELDSYRSSHSYSKNNKFKPT